MAAPLNIEVSEDLAEMLDAASTAPPMSFLARAVTTIIRLQLDLTVLRSAAKAFEEGLSADCDCAEREVLRNLLRQTNK